MNKKDSFVFYGTFLDTIEKLEQAGQQDLAYKVLKAVVDVGIYGEYTGGDPLVESFLPTMQLSIENAAKRYEAASNGGKKSNHSSAFDKDLIIELKLQGMKNADVAKIVGEKSTKGTCSAKTVSRVWNEYKQEMGQNMDKPGQIEMSMDKPGQNLDKSETKIGQIEMSTLEKTGQNLDKSETFTVSW